MIKDLLKNICLITFALIGPITLPAGGIQRNLDEHKFLNNSKEIILTSNLSLYTYPRINAKPLTMLNSGSLLLVIRKWEDREKEVWVRVQLATNQFLDNPNRDIRGWIKI